MRPDGRPSGPGRPEQARLFFALWPAADLATRLGRLAREAADRCGGRATRLETLHLTLAFLGGIAVDRLPAVREAADRVVVAPFEFTIDRLGYWRHNQILWAGGQGVPALQALAAELRESLAAVGFPDREASRPFVPHVTLVRKAGRSVDPLPAIDSLRWMCREMVLVRSRLADRGAIYEVIGRWTWTWGADAKG